VSPDGLVTGSTVSDNSVVGINIIGTSGSPLSAR